MPDSQPDHPDRVPPPPREGERSARRRRLLQWIVLPLLTALLAVGTGVFIGASIDRPEVDELESFQHRLITQIYSNDDEVFQTYSRENRILIPENDMPELLAQAIIAAEDSNFYDHGGIDLKGIARAVVKNIKAGRKKEGASTITMQLARTLFLSRERAWKRKIEEAFLSAELEKKFSKQQILTLYANVVNLGHGNYGMEAASRDFFGKTAADLTIAEAATLAGIPQRPSYFLVRRRPEEVQKRRDYVIGRMLAEGFITQEQHDAAKAQPVQAVQRRAKKQLAPYFAEDVRRYLSKNYGTDALYDRGLQVKTTLDPDIQEAAENALRRGLLELDHGKGWRGAPLGLNEEEHDLETYLLPSWRGLEPRPGEWHQGIVLESSAEAATIRIENETHELDRRSIAWTRRKNMDSVLERGDVAWFRLVQLDEDGEPLPDGEVIEIEEGAEGDEGEPAPETIFLVEQDPELEGAVLVVESSTGAIRAMVGGWDFSRNEFNRATQARRQVGSAFKPFVFGAALENGYTAADTLFDGPAVFVGADNLESYSPRNYYRQYYGISTLRRSLAASYNVSAVKLMDMVGIDRVVEFAHRCGVSSELPPYPSLALGTAELTPLELASSYAAIVNGGIHVEPYLIEQIETSDGRILEKNIPRARKSMDPQEAYILTQMMRAVALTGTGATGPYGLRNIPIDLGGKTGTTNAFTDAWFAGFSPRYTIISWVGYDRTRFLGKGMTGARAALPIWTMLVRQGLEQGWLEEGETFTRPPGVVDVLVDADSGLLPSPASRNKVVEYFVEGSEPDRAHDDEWARILGLPWFLQEPFYLAKEGEKMPRQIADWEPVLEVWENKDKDPEVRRAEEAAAAAAAAAEAAQAGTAAPATE